MSERNEEWLDMKLRKGKINGEEMDYLDEGDESDDSDETEDDYDDYD